MKSNLKVNNPASSKSTSLAKSNSLEPNYSLRRDYAWQVASNLFISFKYAGEGLRYAFLTQRNFRIHIFISLMAISLGLLTRVSAIEMSVITTTCALVMVLELLNTSLESVVDLTVGQSYHELAKIAKDCAAAAVMLSAIAAIIVAGFILFPPLCQLLFSWSFS